jgi:asparagine synthase (glutamine-hydrolysing)
LLKKIYSSELLRNRMLNELFHEVVPVILKHDDLNSMYYSVENRSPFLDKDLLEVFFKNSTGIFNF